MHISAMRTQRLSYCILKMFIGITTGVFLLSTISHAIDKPEYVSGELIIKLKADVPVIDARDTLLVEWPASLSELNEKFKVTKITPVFKNFRANRERLEALKRKDESLLTEAEKHLLRRLKRAPKDAKVPDLERIYKLKLGREQSIEAAVAAYSNDPNIEYAEPNYLIILKPPANLGVESENLKD